MKRMLEQAMPWAISAATIFVLYVSARRNKRAGYQRRPRQPLLADGLLFLYAVQDALTDQKEPVAPQPPVTADSGVDQLMRLSLAVRAADPERTDEQVVGNGKETCAESIQVTSNAI
jgi:hypothetical protein